MRRSKTLTSAVAISLAVLGATAFGQDLRPSSLLVFPEFESTPGIRTFVTVTNTHASQSVTTHWFYVNGADCSFIDRIEVLTPLDTISVLTSFHAPSPGPGYLYVFAMDAQDRPIVFNSLVGTSLVSDAVAVNNHEFLPFAFQGIGAHGSTTDLNANGRVDLDGSEYESTPDRILLPRFIAADGAKDTQLILIGLSGGAGASTIASLLFFNDNSSAFSAQVNFQCWERRRLVDISAAFSAAFLVGNTNQNPLEPVGATNVETGWLRLQGLSWQVGAEVFPDPAILACAIEKPVTRGSSELPFLTGLRTGGSLHTGNAPASVQLRPDDDSGPRSAEGGGR